MPVCSTVVHLPGDEQSVVRVDKSWKFWSRSLYIGVKSKIPRPPARELEIEEAWNQVVKEDLRPHLRKINDKIQLAHPWRNTRETIYQPELLLTGHQMNSTIELSPKIWFRCGSSRVEKIVQKEIHGLTWMAERGLGDRISTRLESAILVSKTPVPVPKRLISLLDSQSQPTVRLPDGHTLHICTQKLHDSISAYGLLIGGFVTIHNAQQAGIYAVTSAHGLLDEFLDASARKRPENVRTFSQIAGKAFDKATSLVGTSRNLLFGTEKVLPKRKSQRISAHGTTSEKELDNVEWELVQGVHSTSWLGLGWEVGNKFQHPSVISDPEKLVPDADFTLLELSSETYNMLHQQKDDPGRAPLITDWLKDDDLVSGPVQVIMGGGDVISQTALVQANLLHERPHLFLRGTPFPTRKLELSQPLASGTSGAWVVRGESLCGMIVASYETEPFAHIITAEKLLSDMKKTLGDKLVGQPLIGIPDRVDHVSIGTPNDSFNNHHENQGESNTVTEGNLYGALDVSVAAVSKPFGWSDPTTDESTSNGLREELALNIASSPQYLPVVTTPQSINRSEDDFASIERLQLRRARLQRELEYLEMVENVSSLEFKVENLRKRLGVSPEQLRDCDRHLPASDQSVISQTAVSTRKAPTATLGPSPGAGVQEASVSHPTVSEAITPGLTQGTPVASTPPAHGSMPNNAIAPSGPSTDHPAIEDQEPWMSSLLPSLVTPETSTLLALEYFKGPVPLDSDEEHFVNMNLEDLQSLAQAMGQSNDNWKLLGYIYYMMFMKTQTIAHLDQAIEQTEMALKSLPAESGEYWNVVKRLIVMLADGFESAQRGDKLVRAVNYGNEMINITKPYHVDRKAIIGDIYRIKIRHAVENRSQNEFDEAIFATEMALQATDVMDENHDLDEESDRLFKTFKQTNKLEHLDRAIEVAENAIALTADYYILKPARLSNLSRFLIARFNETKNVYDLDKAIERGEESITSVPSDYPHRGAVLAKTAGLLAARFDLKGDTEDLRLLNIRAQRAAELMSENNEPDTYKVMTNLSSCFLYRYMQVQDPEDLARAIKWIEEALKSDSPNHPVYASTWNTAAAASLYKFRKERKLEDLEKAIQRSEKSLIAPWDGNQSDKIHASGNLAAIYGTAYHHLRDAKYLDLSIEKGKQALPELTKNGDRSAIIRSNLSVHLSSRFKLASDPQDLQDAIGYAEGAVDLSSPAEPNRARWLHNLAQCLVLRDGDANERAADLWEEAARLINAPPTFRMVCAFKAAKIFCSVDSWERANKLITNMVPLLPQMVPRQLAQHDQQEILERFGGVTAIATVGVLERIEQTETGREEQATEALTLLELGRGVITGLRFGMRPDLDALREKRRDLAARFEELRDKLESPIQDWQIPGFGSGTFGLQCETNDRHELSSQLDDVIQEIRVEEGFERFQLPPSITELKNTASLGPIVVINVSIPGCHALIVQPQSIESLRLRDLQYDDLVQKVEDIKAIRHLHPLSSQKKASLSSILEWLWDVAVGPILEYLGYKDPPSGEWPRVWWIPTGPLSLLPLHAAGYHSSSNKSALDRVISSYSSSIKALQYSRQVSKSNSRLVINRPALLISMPKTPGQNPLHFAREEVDELDKLLPDKMERSILSLPTTQKVVDSLANCSIFHFAGHGESHPVNPSKSLLFTNDWGKDPLTVEKLFGLNLRQNSPSLAYLSACSTNDNNTDKLYDEAISLVTACQLAGFQHVVGTMWEVADEYCVNAAKEVYQAIMADYDGTIDGAKIALGVHQAVRHLRDISGGWETRRDATLEPDPGSRNEEAGIQADQGQPQRKARPWASREEVQTGGNDPLIWAAYIHVGP